MRIRTRRAIAFVLALAVISLAFATSPAVHAEVEEIEYFSYVIESKPAPSQAQTARRAFCPRGSVVIGGGVYTSGTTTEDEVATSAPFDGKDRDRKPDDGWLGEINTGPLDAEMTTIAICVPFLGIKYVKGEMSVRAGRRGVDSTRCPDSASQVVTGGVKTPGTSTKITLGGLFDENNGMRKWDVEVNNGTAKRIVVKRYAVCRNPAFGIFTTSSLTLPAPPGQSAFQVSCTGDLHLAGGGVRVPYGLKGEIAGLRPFDDGSDLNDAPDDGWEVFTNNETALNQNGIMQLMCLS
jgi:hypothetical protein